LAPRIETPKSLARLERRHRKDVFGDMFERVRADYVEKPEDSKLVESAINGMLAGLDPHSGYMNPHTFRDMQVQTRGEFGGLGIEDAHSGSPRSAALALQHRRGEEARRSPLMTVSAVSPWRTAPFEAAITADYDAQSVVERELVLRLASILWRLRRATTMETGLFEIQAQHLYDYRQSASCCQILVR
jgi:hypothetical protein